MENVYDVIKKILDNHDKATRIDFETIEKLCALFSCDISSLLELEGVKEK